MSDYWEQDIVFRLTERARVAQQEGTGTAISDATHFNQAAEEISRLRKAIDFSRVMIDHFVHGEEGFDALHEAHKSLRDARKEQTNPSHVQKLSIGG